MRKFPLIISITFIVCTSVALFFSCDREEDKQVVEEIQTARPTVKSCYTICDVNKNPDLQLVTNAQEVRPLLPDGQIDSFSYFWTKYHIRTNPIRLTQNFLVTSPYTLRYGWDSGVLVNRVQLQCLVENIAPFGCNNDWVFTESQGYLASNFNYFFDGLFSFETQERGNGNNWKPLYIDYKKEFNPSTVPNQDNIASTFCYYDRAVQAQTGDFYYNYFRFPNHDGIYRLVLKFNPSIKGCRAVKETNYNNNDVTVELEIREGAVIIR